MRDEHRLAWRALSELDRNNVTEIAEQLWREEIDTSTALDQLAPYHPGLTDLDRADLLGELLSEIQYTADVRDDLISNLGWTKADLEQLGQQLIDQAADKLIAPEMAKAPTAPRSGPSTPTPSQGVNMHTVQEVAW